MAHLQGHSLWQCYQRAFISRCSGVYGPLAIRLRPNGHSRLNPRNSSHCFPQPRAPIHTSSARLFAVSGNGGGAKDGSSGSGLKGDSVHAAASKQAPSFTFRLRPEQPQSVQPEFHHDKLSPADLDAWLKKRREPANLSDRIALKLAESLSVPALIFFRRKYVHRAVVLETIAAVPGMVGGSLRHLRSLRLMRHDGGWIHYLLAEAENERMHLLTWMKVAKPGTLERILVLVSQLVFFQSYFFLYLFAPSIAHRMVGFLAEESVVLYTDFLTAMESGRLTNKHAPQIAIDYWSLPQTATLRDVILAIRTDEAHHRDVNHHLADRIIARNEDLRNHEDVQ